MIDADWTRAAKAAIDEATTGAMDTADGAFLLRTTADLLAKLWDQGLIPNRVWTRIVVQGAITILTNTADELDPQPETEPTP